MPIKQQRRRKGGGGKRNARQRNTHARRSAGLNGGIGKASAARTATQITDVIETTPGRVPHVGDCRLHCLEGAIRPAGLAATSAGPQTGCDLGTTFTTRITTTRHKSGKESETGGDGTIMHEERRLAAVDGDAIDLVSGLLRSCLCTYHGFSQKSWRTAPRLHLRDSECHRMGLVVIFHDHCRLIGYVSRCTTFMHIAQESFSINVRCLGTPQRSLLASRRSSSRPSTRIKNFSLSCLTSVPLSGLYTVSTLMYLLYGPNGCDCAIDLCRRR
ncbi:hypothetical protein BV25DRAFT_1192217 [Artomyces pyxidatus]|uniref:Uncharacterized protein n=1 Tax=Artomyces pyxidatus TaxID=48021 RepID=A0ACB8SS38_9AGAM|nr:hypothetical protein BV25DRAFT_1192217 [Artomyces pyxidatus]